MLGSIGTGSGAYPFDTYAHDFQYDQQQLTEWWTHALRLAAERPEGFHLESTEAEFHLAWELQHHTDLRLEMWRHEECSACGAEASKDESNRADTFQMLACPSEHVSVWWTLQDENDNRLTYGWPENFMTDHYPSRNLVGFFQELERTGRIPAPQVAA